MQEDSRHARLLVVDDEVVIVHVVRQAFEQAGFIVTGVGDGTQASALLLKESYDAAIIDKNLPGVDGVQLCKLARERNQEMAILLMTAYATRESAAELLKVGIDDYVQKPFDLDELTGRVKNILVRRIKVVQASRVAEAARARRGKVRHGVLVDHSAVHRQAVESALTDLGVQVECAAAVPDPDPAVDVLVLSARLIDPALADRVGEARIKRPDLKVVIVSDRHSLDDDIAAIMVGACAEIELPMEPKSLQTALANGLGLEAPAR